jgi:hypothetical protein
MADVRGLRSEGLEGVTEEFVPFHWLARVIIIINIIKPLIGAK